MFTSSMKRWARHGVMAASIVVSGTLVMGATSAPAKAQTPYGYYPYYNPYYSQYYPYYPVYPYGYAAPFAPAFNVGFGFGPRFFRPGFFHPGFFRPGFFHGGFRGGFHGGFHR